MALYFQPLPWNFSPIVLTKSFFVSGDVDVKKFTVLFFARLEDDSLELGDANLNVKVSALPAQLGF